MLIFKILITAMLLASGIYLDVRKSKSAFVGLVFYVPFLLMLIHVFEVLLDWPESVITVTCLLIYVGILLVVRMIKKHENER